MSTHLSNHPCRGGGNYSPSTRPVYRQATPAAGAGTRDSPPAEATERGNSPEPPESPTASPARRVPRPGHGLVPALARCRGPGRAPGDPGRLQRRCRLHRGAYSCPIPSASPGRPSCTGRHPSTPAPRPRSPCWPSPQPPPPSGVTRRPRHHHGRDHRARRLDLRPAARLKRPRTLSVSVALPLRGGDVLIHRLLTAPDPPQWAVIETPEGPAGIGRTLWRWYARPDSRAVHITSAARGRPWPRRW
jgi:hypothetical protein